MMCVIRRARAQTCHYFVLHVRAVVRTRVLCQAGRASADGGMRDEVMVWLCERAPLWVVVRVCELLRRVCLSDGDLSYGTPPSDDGDGSGDSDGSDA